MLKSTKNKRIWSKSIFKNTQKFQKKNIVHLNTLLPAVSSPNKKFYVSNFVKNENNTTMYLWNYATIPKTKKINLHSQKPDDDWAGASQSHKWHWSHENENKDTRLRQQNQSWEVKKSLSAGNWQQMTCRCNKWRHVGKNSY